ncbi:helitron_like_N domain-containing protein [Trichonephila clavipes]|uniref:Helitron_like_N domain-containing protein n=1 Tax=Trichonephila clavipes TaxID=2585209 RepID=A0A8X6V416_TRICX|nr:helitron_like_N domain-containing protein [Trichonephila clavipes]
MYHTIGSLPHATDTETKFLQVYFMGDKEAQVNRRSEYAQSVERNTVQKTQHDRNILVQELKMAKDRVPSDNYKVVIHLDRLPRREHERQFNTPNTNEIAAVVVSSEQELLLGTSLFRHMMAGLLEFRTLIDFMMLFSTR